MRLGISQRVVCVCHPAGVRSVGGFDRSFTRPRRSLSASRSSVRGVSSSAATSQHLGRKLRTFAPRELLADPRRRVREGCATPAISASGTGSVATRNRSSGTRRHATNWTTCTRRCGPLAECRRSWTEYNREVRFLVLGALLASTLMARSAGASGASARADRCGVTPGAQPTRPHGCARCIPTSCRQPRQVSTLQYDARARKSDHHPDFRLHVETTPESCEQVSRRVRLPFGSATGEQAREFATLHDKLFTCSS